MDESARKIARTILDGFDRRYRQFRQMGAEAKRRFERGDWAGGRTASRVYIDTYDLQVIEAVRAVVERFPLAGRNEALWPSIKHAYIALLYDHKQPECAETFFNSVACRVLDRTYYRNEYLFWRPSVSTEFIDAAQPTYHCWYPATHGLRRTLLEIVRSFDLKVPFENLRRDLRYVMRALGEAFPAPRERHPNFQVQVLSSLFYRNKGAYIVGRIVNGNLEHPFAVPLRHAKEGRGLRVDALLLTREHIGSLFSLARTYFMVDMEVPSAWVSFLQQLMPSKSRAELYTAVGLQKQGKTLFYRDLQEHLKHSSDRFVIAEGTRGLVMMVFTLPSLPYVFKVIRDSFGAPKQTTQREVKAKYLLVKYHDRVGRMADTLEYSEVAFPVDRFDPALLSELEASCSASLQWEGDRRAGGRVIIKHLYIERRMVPLDVWLRKAEAAGDEARLRHGIAEFGRAIREIAEANIFPGDMLLKNFGVTRWGRVVFYDYDEISYLTDVHFRKMPAPRDFDDEMSAEPWFPVGPHDVFPEEFPPFLFPPGRLRELFLELHPMLVDADWWTACQAEIRAGGQRDFIPYPEEIRFSSRF